jgi:BirA family biotin operon repressor/biotin-[acetyl-CoA-carboxylase] ligase
MMLYYDQLDSTNRIAKELVTTGEISTHTVVRAAAQSAGKGQYGRSFDSPPGGLYFTLILQPDLPVERLPLITLATGLACRNVLYDQYKLQPQIKWPNDIYLEKRKVAGILCEHISTGVGEQALSTVIIGVGLNCNTPREDFATELVSVLTTLKEQVHTEIDLDALLTLLVSEITAQVHILGENPQQILAQWQQHDYLVDKQVLHTSGTTLINGIGKGITAQGYYRIIDHLGVEHCVLGGWLRPQS